jgi:cellulose synthase/poly-beta-1,6-N-acetylglucosamine synthase-like glycosyltransferase
MMPQSSFLESRMPSVSIIVPSFNEQGKICKMLEAVYAQTYPRLDLEVIIADGMSTDATRAEVAAFTESHPDLRICVVDNLRRFIPSGLNCALAQAEGEIIVRLDAHSMPRPDYIERSVADLEAGLGENVGGVWEIVPGASTWIGRSIAAAASHPLGVGDALYRRTNKAAEVDTVPFGAFKRELLALVGFFDETLLTNEDYEFNTRIRQSGRRVWLDPAIRSTYIARPTLAGLWQQYTRYGYWKWQMLRRYPKTLRWRQALPPVFVISLLVGTILAVFSSFLRVLFGLEIGLYAIILFAASILAALRQKDAALIAGLPLAIATMHIAWGGGFLWSIIKTIFTGQKKKES